MRKTIRVRPDMTRAVPIAVRHRPAARPVLRVDSSDALITPLGGDDTEESDTKPQAERGEPDSDSLGAWMFGDDG